MPQKSDSTHKSMQKILLELRNIESKFLIAKIFVDVSGEYNRIGSDMQNFARSSKSKNF